MRRGNKALLASISLRTDKWVRPGILGFLSATTIYTKDGQVYRDFIINASTSVRYGVFPVKPWKTALTFSISGSYLQRIIGSIFNPMTSYCPFKCLHCF